MAVTIKSSILNYDGATALTGEVSIQDGTTVINGAGSGTSVTFGARLSCSFTFSDTITPGIYEVRFVKADGTVWASGLVWIEASSGTYYVNDIARLAVYQQRLAVNLESPERDTADTAVIEFYWPIASATFANSASTCKRRFLGETGAQEEALSGAISAISGKAGWYKLVYAIADRAADAATVIPTSVTYTLVDDAGNTGELTLVIVEFTSASGIAVLPGRDRAVADAGASTITVKLGEIITIARAVVDANGQPMDLSGFSNLQFVVQDARGLDLARVDHADITISGADDDTYSFVTPSGMTAKLGVFDFSLNQVGGGQIVGGKWIVLRRAVAD